MSAGFKQPIGVNKLNGLLKTMALRAHLPDLPYMRITNTSVRKHLCQKLLDSNISDTHAIHITGHKSPQSLNNYRKLSNKQKQHVSTLLSSSGGQNENQNFRKPQYLPIIPSNPISEPHVHVPEVQRLIPSTPILNLMYMYLRFRDLFHQIQFLNLMYMYLRFRDLFHQLQFLNLMYMYLRFRDLFHQLQFLNLMYMYLRFRDLFHQLQFLNLMYMYLRFRDLFHHIQSLNLMYMYLRFRDSLKNPASVNPVKTAENAAGHQSLNYLKQHHH